MHRSVVALIALSTAVACAGEPEEAAPVLPVDVLTALQRDLGQTEQEIALRLVAEAEAARVEPGLRDQLGDRYGGAWMADGGGQLQVAITDPADADAVRAAGGEPVVVARSLARLDALKGALDDDADLAGSDVHAWYVDVATNQIVVAAADPASAQVAAFVDRRGADRAAVRVVASPERPRPLYDVRGGDEIILGGSILCSMGFAVDRGYVTAGHCGGVGTQTAGSNWVASGTVRGSVFPTADQAWVELDGSWSSLPQVGNHAGGVVDVHGSQDAVVGSSICRSGRTTGWRCGQIQARGVTINYAAGPVYGAVQTSACAQGGDSGGSFISGNQAQGVTSGGSGNCTTGGTTFFYPVNPILGAYGLRLKTVGGGTTREIVSRWNGRCIDVPGSSFVDGAQLQMWDCNGTGAQRWTFEGGTIRAGGKCMDVAWASTADGAAIQLANCSGNRAQQFVMSATGDLVSVLSSKCVDIKDWNGDRGARLQTWSCAGTANQRWFTR